MESVLLVSLAVVVSLVAFLSLCLHCRKPAKTKEEIMQKRFRKFSKHHMIPSDKLANHVDIIRPAASTEHLTPPISLCDSEHQYEEIKEAAISNQPAPRPPSECSFLDESFQTVIQNAGLTLPTGQINNLNIPPSVNNLSSSRASYISFHQTSHTFLHNTSTIGVLEQSSMSEESNWAVSPSSAVSPFMQDALPIMKPLNRTYLVPSCGPRIVVTDHTNTVDAASDSVFIPNDDNTSIMVKTPKSKSIDIHLVSNKYPSSKRENELSPKANLTAATSVDKSYESIHNMPRNQPLRKTAGLAKRIPRCSDHTYESLNDDLCEGLGRGDFTDLEYTDRTRNRSVDSVEDNTYESLRGDRDFTTYEMCEGDYNGTNYMNNDHTNITDTSPIDNHYESVESLRSHFEQIGRQRNVYRDKSEDRYSPFPVATKLALKRSFNATPKLSLMKSVSGNLKITNNQSGETVLKCQNIPGVNTPTETHVPEQLDIYTPTSYDNHGADISLELETPIKATDNKNKNSDKNIHNGLNETMKQNEYLKMSLQNQNTSPEDPSKFLHSLCSVSSPNGQRNTTPNATRKHTTDSRSFSKPSTPSQAIAKSFLSNRDIRSPFCKPGDQGHVRLTQPKPWGYKKSLPSLPDYIQEDINLHFSNELYVSTPYMFMSPVFNLPASEI